MKNKKMSGPAVFMYGTIALTVIISAVAAMIFDAQFIVVHRYNRPIVIRLMERKKKRAQAV